MKTSKSGFIQRKQFLGYYLGYKFIRWLEREYSLEEIAKLEKEKIKILQFLR
ncbi:hypothetical protein ADU37_CDS12240 [Thermococcus sp. 2319x1]|uniref:hypothetical protein n=1 Tax=Thermococcus sp. 2319x1 TaxID=1674923 RepID=UPI00073AB052|nr:hypothetical protein [Thermococcus sp. 2319x1]ALV62923.1 hypothetical protein ADU37_CDS12240 [Thermococcus sp. 2319x1]